MMHTKCLEPLDAVDNGQELSGARKSVLLVLGQRSKRRCAPSDLGSAVGDQGLRRVAFRVTAGTREGRVGTGGGIELIIPFPPGEWCLGIGMSVPEHLWCSTHSKRSVYICSAGRATDRHLHPKG